MAAVHIRPKGMGISYCRQIRCEVDFLGENGELEYGGSTEYKNKPKEDPDVWDKYYFRGTTVDKLAEIGIETGIFRKEEINEHTLQWYKSPPPERLVKKAIEIHWFSYYQKWTPQENFYYCVKNTGFNTNDEGRTESTYTKYVSLDDKQDGFHFYLGYMKFGMARATRDAAQDIRRHHITREEGVALVRRYDDEFPKKHFRWFLDYLNITEETFWEVMDFWREQSKVWKKENGVWKLKKAVYDE